MPLPKDQQRLLRVRAAPLAVALAVSLGACSAAQNVAEGGHTGVTPASSGTTPTTSGPTPTPTPTATTTTPNPAPAPANLACRVLKKGDIPRDSNNDPTVPCRSSHTAQTFYVGRWPARLFKPPVTSADPQLKSYAIRHCTRAFNAFVGGSPLDRQTTLLTWAFFVPAPSELLRQSNWFRCDVISGWTLAGHLYSLPTSMHGILDSGVPDDVRTCFTRLFVNNGTKKDPGRYVPCTMPHAQRAIAALQLGGKSDPFPSVKSQESRLNAWCGPKVQAYLGNPSSYKWGYSFVTRKKWRSGDRFGTCYAVTSS